MHEVAIVKNVLDTVEKVAIQNGVGKVTHIHLVIGKLRAVLPEAVQMGFKALPKSKLFDGCELTFEEKPIIVHCNSCSNEYECGFPSTPCPACGGEGNKIIQGRELYIDHFEC